MDIVYFIREGQNEELRYSLRSLKNLIHDKVWIYGGCPKGIKPDRFVPVRQVGATKWDRVRNMYRMVCLNEDISEDFIMMNDDFFVMKPTAIPIAYRSSLHRHILTIEMKYGDRINPYTRNLRSILRKLDALNLDTRSYELHIPFVFNRKKLLKLITEYPDVHATRTFYGNYYRLGGIQMNDVKVLRGDTTWKDTPFLSTDDASFNRAVGKYIKGQFPERCKYETD